MKDFKTYLAESTHTYDFRIKLACELDSEKLDKLKQVLEAYQVDTISKPKRLPVHEHVDFPQAGPTEVNIIDVKVHYPVTGLQLRQMIYERTGIALSCIKVIDGGEHSTYENILDGKEQSNEFKEGESVLTQHEMTAPEQGDIAGQKRISSIMKELEDARKTAGSEYCFAAKSEADGKTTNDLPQGNIDPVGSKQNKIPDPYKGRK